MTTTIDDVERDLKPQLGTLTDTVRLKLAAAAVTDDEWASVRARVPATWADVLTAVASMRKRRETRPGGSADPYAQGWPTVEARARAHWAQLEPDSRARVVAQLRWDPVQQRQHDPLDWYDLADLACGALISQRMRAAEQQDLAQARADGTLDWVHTIVAGITARKAKS